MANYFDRFLPLTMHIGANTSTIAKTGLQLDTAYTYNSAGKAVAVRFNAPATTTVTDVYFFVSAVTGTPGSTTVELRNVNTLTAPGSTAIATNTVSPGTTPNKWIHCTLSGGSVTVGNQYWIVIGDAAGSVSNNITVLYQGGVQQESNSVQGYDSQRTTGGWASGNTDGGTAPPIVIKFNDGTVLGNPFTTSAAYTSNTRERGVRITGLTSKLVLTALLANLGANVSGFKIYSGSTVPGGTADLTVSFATNIATSLFPFFAPFTLQANTNYRIVFTFSGSATNPSYVQIEDFSGNTDVTNCGIGGGTMYSTIDNGSGGWTDEIDKYPRMTLIFQDTVAAVPGGAPIVGSGIIVPGRAGVLG